MKAISHIIIVFVLLSCSKDGGPDTPDERYVPFKAEDHALLLNTIETGDTFQLGDGISGTRTMSIDQAYLWERQFETGGSFWGSGGSTLVRYEERGIRFTIYNSETDRSIGGSIQISRLHANDSLRATLSFPIWNDPEDEDLVFDLYGSSEPLNINGVQYNNVITLRSRYNVSGDSIFGVAKDIWRIYYDLDHGIVGFDGTDDRHWRLNR